MNPYNQILAEIREHKRNMRERGIRVISFMNGGLTRDEVDANANLFRLKTKLRNTPKQTAEVRP